MKSLKNTLHFRPSQQTAAAAADEDYYCSTTINADFDSSSSDKEQWCPKYINNNRRKKKRMGYYYYLLLLRRMIKNIFKTILCYNCWRKGGESLIFFDGGFVRHHHHHQQQQGDNDDDKKWMVFESNTTTCNNKKSKGNTTKTIKNILQFLLISTLVSIVWNEINTETEFQKNIKGQTKKPRILRLVEIYNGEKGARTSSVSSSTRSISLVFDSIHIPKGRLHKLLRRRATDWFYFHEDTRSQEELDKLTSREPFETEHCKAMYEWQKQSFPTCNILHENQIQSSDVGANTIQKINYGFFRDIWRIQVLTDNVSYKHDVVLKTLRTDKEYDEYNADRHRRDAVALERLTSSPHVVNIYGHCMNSQITEYSGEGDVYDAVFHPKTSSAGSPAAAAAALSKGVALRIAIQVATGIADMHNLGREGRAPMAHTDISPTQFILIDGYYKLNDFNRVRFIRWNSETNEPCPYQVMNNPGEFRSPEEYEYGNQTEKVDVYSMGNVFYVLLTSTWPWEGIEEEEAQKLVMEGKRPYVDESVRRSANPIDRALLKAMDMCYIHDQSQRASASDVLRFLTREQNKIISGRNTDHREIKTI